MRRALSLIAIVLIASIACSGGGGSSDGSSDDGGSAAGGSSGDPLGGSGGGGLEIAALSADTLIFVKTVGQARHLYRLDTASGQSALIHDLDNPTTPFSPSLSPDRRLIAFDTYFRLEDDALESRLPTNPIWVVSADGQRLRQVTPASPPTESSECQVDSQCEPYGMVCNLGWGRCQLAQQTRGFGSLTWAPDGATLWMVYSDHWWEGSRLTGGATLAKLPAAGGVPEVLQLQSGCAQVTGPAVRPDGQAIAVVHSVCSGGDPGIVLYGLPPGSPTQVLVSPTYEIDPGLGAPVWLPGGEALIFQATDTTSGDPIALLVRASVGGSAPEIIARAASGQSFGRLALAPDGHRMVVCAWSNQDGASDLYLLDLDDQAAGLSPLTEDGVSCNPDW